MYVQNALKMHNAYSSPQLVKNHIVQGLVFGPDLEDDLVGTTIGDTKLRSNIYYSENEHWKEVVVSQTFLSFRCVPMFVQAPRPSRP